MSLRFAFFDLPSARHGAPCRSIAANRHGLRARPVTHAGTLPRPPSYFFFLFFLSFLYVSRRTSAYPACVSEYTCFPSRASRTCLGYSSGVSSCIYHRYLYPLRVHIVGRCGANRNRRSPARVPHDLFLRMQASASSSA